MEGRYIERIVVIATLWFLGAGALAANWNDSVRTGTDAFKRGDYAEAERSLTTALKQAEMSTKDEASLLPAMEGLAICYAKLSKFAQAEALLRRCIGVREKTHEDSLDLAFDLIGLGHVLSELGRYNDAEAIYKRALGISEKLSGPNGTETSIALNNLAGVYTNEERYSEAEPLLKRSLAISEKRYGVNSSDSAITLNNLADLYLDEKKLEESEQLFKRALAITEKSQGPNHPDAATILLNLAQIYDERDSHEQSERLLQRALAIREKAFGSSSPQAASCLTQLSANYVEQGKSAEALKLLQQALKIQESSLGSNHPDVATTLYCLAVVNTRQGNYAQAQELFKRSNDIRQKLLGSGHPNVPAIIDKLSSARERQRQNQIAEEPSRTAITTAPPAVASDAGSDIAQSAPPRGNNQPQSLPAPVRAEQHLGSPLPPSNVDTTGSATTHVPDSRDSNMVLPAAPSETLAPSQIAGIAYPSTVMIVSEDKNQQASLGSGFFVSGTLIATNLHTISGAKTALAKTVGANQVLFPILGTVAVDRENDLALLAVGVYNSHWLTLGDSEKIQIGDPIFALGNPQGLEGTFSTGIVSAKRTYGRHAVLQITAPISQGSSGGPVLDARGTVIGLSQAILHDGQNLNFAVDVAALKVLMTHAGQINPLSSIAAVGKDSPGNKLAQSSSVRENVLATHVVAARNKSSCSFSIENRLSTAVTNIRYVIVAVDSDGSPVDSVEAQYDGGKGTILPGLAKAVRENLAFPDSKRIAGLEVRVLGYKPL